MTDTVDAAWAAGLYEGEGTIYCYRGQRGLSVKVSIRMCDPEPLARLQRLFGGSFYGPYIEAGHPEWSPKYAWQLGAWRDVLPFCAAVRGLLSPRRLAQMDAVLERQPRVPRGTMPCHLPVEPSWSGYKKHRLAGEPPCERCKQSHQMALRRRYVTAHPHAKAGVQRL